MLNEGYVLFKSLERCGIRAPNRHRDVSEPGRKEGLVVGLNEKGTVQTLEYRKAEEMVKLWTIRDGKQNSFPILKLQRPLWKVDQNDIIRKSRDAEVEKKNLLFQYNHKLNITNVEENWWERLQIKVKQLQPIIQGDIINFSALYELTKRFLLTEKVDLFLSSLLDKLRELQTEIKYSLLETILIGNKWDRNKNEYRAEVPLVLDLSDWEKYQARIASPKMESFVNQCLFNMMGKDGNNKSKYSSALSGINVELENDKFPSPKLPIIGETFLFAVNKDTPCQSRYGKTSTDIIPIGRKESIAIQDSLRWITNKEREQKTWTSVPSGKVEIRNKKKSPKNDLLIAYLENKPDINVNKAHMLGGVSKNDFSESNYEATAKIAIDALKGKDIVKTNNFIRIFTLRKADPGRTHVSLQRVYTISELVQADEAWREAAKNCPIFSLPFFRKEIERIMAKQQSKSESISQFLNSNESNAIFLSPSCPFPADFVRLTQKQWIRFGQDTSSVAGASLGDIYDVFFDLQNRQTHLTESLLDLTIQKTQSLLIGIGNADHKNEIYSFYSEARFTVLKTISAFSIYLYKLGIKKENYMKDTFFYIGRFLSLIDTLHFEWCTNVRDGNIPPQLLGNAHLQIALDNPVSAFDILSRRINVYQAWTKKEKGEQAKLGRWAVGELGKISDLLAEKTLPASTTSVERAQILLGYLSRPEKKPETDLAKEIST